MMNPVDRWWRVPVREAVQVLSMKQGVIILVLAFSTSRIWAVVWYVPEGSNLTQAIASSGSGDTVMVGPGSFHLSGEIQITNSITVKSEYGPEWTVIDAEGLSRCFKVDDTQTVLSGLSFKGGYTTNNGGAVLCHGTQVVVSNCVFYDNEADMNGGAVAGGTIYRSVFRNNTASGNGGGLYQGKAVNSLFHGNRSYENGGAIYGSAVYSCTLSANTALMSGGGMYGGTALNSIIQDNLAGGPFDDVYMVSATNCCSPDLVPSVNGNLIDVFGFVNPAAWDFRLSTNSPCVDAGTNTPFLLRFDLDGVQRVFGTSVDMGAYEFGSSIPDTDLDGLPDEWELACFGSVTGAVSTLDSDGDRYTNMDEFIAGTRPTDAASNPDLYIEGAALAPVLKWTCVPERVYEVKWAESMTNSFQAVITNLSFPQTSATDVVHSAEMVGFYRLKISRD